MILTKNALLKSYFSIKKNSERFEWFLTWKINFESPILALYDKLAKHPRVLIIQEYSYFCKNFWNIGLPQVSLLTLMTLTSIISAAFSVCFIITVPITYPSHICTGFRKIYVLCGPSMTSCPETSGNRPQRFPEGFRQIDKITGNSSALWAIFGQIC